MDPGSTACSQSPSYSGCEGMEKVDFKVFWGAPACLLEKLHALYTIQKAEFLVWACLVMPRQAHSTQSFYMAGAEQKHITMCQLLSVAQGRDGSCVHRSWESVEGAVRAQSGVTQPLVPLLKAVTGVVLLSDWNITSDTVWITVMHYRHSFHPQIHVPISEYEFTYEETQASHLHSS